MTTFDKKEKAHEDKYARDQEKEFKIHARRNKLLGLWAANLLHYEKERADVYAREVVMADFEEAGDEDVFRKIKNDLEKAGMKISEHDIREQMHALMQTAADQINSEG